MSDWIEKRESKPFVEFLTRHFNEVREPNVLVMYFLYEYEKTLPRAEIQQFIEDPCPKCLVLLSPSSDDAIMVHSVPDSCIKGYFFDARNKAKVSNESIIRFCPGHAARGRGSRSNLYLENGRCDVTAFKCLLPSQALQKMDSCLSALNVGRTEPDKPGGEV